MLTYRFVTGRDYVISVPGFEYRYELPDAYVHSAIKDRAIEDEDPETK